MAQSKSSKSWLKEHFDDAWVKESKHLGYRSRACFKLLEIQDKDHLIRPGMTVVDLGAAPGGWSQVARELSGPSGRVFASDILPMEEIPGVTFIQGDFTEEEPYQRILQNLDNAPVDIVISDMAPNMSGVKAIDQPRAIHLAELAVDLAGSILKCNGSLLLKVFHGEGLAELQGQLRDSFNSVKTRKPRSSRARSSEHYLLAQGFKGGSARK